MKSKILLILAISVMCFCGAKAQSTPNAPTTGSKIKVEVATSRNDFTNTLLCSAFLENSGESPYVFKGTVTEIQQWKHIRFTYMDSEGNSCYYAVKDGEEQHESDLFAKSLELKKVGSGTSSLCNTGATVSNVTITAVLSEDLETLTVTMTQPTPLSVIINGAEKHVSDDIYADADGVIPFNNAVNVSGGTPVPVKVKIGSKEYGVSGQVTFDADNKGAQSKETTLVENGDALTLDVKGSYDFVLVLNADGTKTLRVNKAAAGNELTLDDGTAFVYNEATGVWEGSVKFTKNQELPIVWFAEYNPETNEFVKNPFYFQGDIDGSDRTPKTVELTEAGNGDAKHCLYAGTYDLSIKFNDKGNEATVTYECVDLEIKDLYVCVYDRHYRNNQFNYLDGDTFSFDYKVTNQLEDGSYVISICMGPGQSFYILNGDKENGYKEYRPNEEDKATSFGTGQDDMKTFIFKESNDSKLRKQVSYDGDSYRVLYIKPNGKNLEVKGYKVADTDYDNYKALRMEVVRNLVAPTNELNHMADVIVRFTGHNGSEEEGYLTEYRKMQLNPSGTHGLYDLFLKEGQTFEIYRGRAIVDASGKVTGIDETDKVQYGCNAGTAIDNEPASLIDGDISTLVNQYVKPKTMTYKVVREGEFKFVVFYTAVQQQLTISRKVKQDRGIKIAVYDTKDVTESTKPLQIVDMQYKIVNRRNLMTVKIPKGGCAKFGFQSKGGDFEPIDFYYLGLSNKVGYDTELDENNKEARQQFDAIDTDYADGDNECWYRFRIRLREDGGYYLSHQVIPMPETVWLYVTSGGNTTGYSAKESTTNRGHYIFSDVDIPLDAEYYFVNTKDAQVRNDLNWDLDDPTNGVIWYSAHTSSMNGGTDGNPVMPGKWINMFSHLNVGTDYQGASYQFNKFKYLSANSADSRDLTGIEIDMDITTMSHRFAHDYSGQHFQFVGSCAGIQEKGEKDWLNTPDAENFKFEYHPTTGYYTCYLPYLWGDWFIYYYDAADRQQTAYYPFNLNNVIHELGQPYYLSDGQNMYISDAKVETPTGLGANTSVTVEKTVDAKDNNKVTYSVSPDYKNRFMIAMAPGATSLIQTSSFQNDWVNSPVYKDVTVVFDSANNVLWLESGRSNDTSRTDNPYGELYLVFADVSPEKWAESRKKEAADAEAGEHWVKLTPDPDRVGHFTGKGVTFPARKIEGGATSSHSAYFFSNSLGMTLAETIRYSNSYHAEGLDPVLSDSNEEESAAGTDVYAGTDGERYGSVYTKLSYNSEGNNGKGTFETSEKPISLVRPANTAYANKIYLRRWDNKDGAPYDHCIVWTDGDEAESLESAPRKAVADNGTEDDATENEGSAGETGNTGETESTGNSIYVETVDDAPNVGANDYEFRTFASEPYTYDVDVDLGKELFKLTTTPKWKVPTSIEEIDNDNDNEENVSNAVIRVAAGHISVAGASSVSVYTISGQCIVSGVPSVEMDVPSGIYIIVADGHATKYAL